MFRNLYDSYNTTWSPQGRLFQLEYAMEAVKQGSCTVGLRSKTHALVVTLKRSSSELGSYQQKIFEIDNHCGVAISGLCGDARLLCRFMRTECLNHKFVYEAPIPIERLVTSVSNSLSHTLLFPSPLLVAQIFSFYFFFCVVLHRVSSSYSGGRSASIRCGSSCCWL